MNLIKSALLGARNCLCASSRQQRLAQLASTGEVPCSVAFYHRVADTVANGWTMSTQQFREHIDYFQSRMTIVDLAEVQWRVREGHSVDQSMSITFDDGYADNMDYAIPLLIERDIPCTYFVTTQNVIDGKPFPHDRDAGRPLQPNTVAQIREMSDAGIEIGCHTRRHVDFSNVHSIEHVRSEIIEAKDELEQMIGRPVHYFAFPFGLPAQLTQAAIEIVHEAGFAGFCSAFGAYNHIGNDWFHIRRFHGDPEFERLVNWCTYDTAKARTEPRVQYFLPPAKSFEQTQAMMPSMPVPHITTFGSFHA
ncbi:polysaccharide deacetylase family protein [Rubripirellula amarantea]|nr:polysaccharide deacetylase family protein [Rubripirellula amarantea]